MKKIILIIIVLVSTFNAQGQDFEDLLSGGEEHAGALTSAYLQPVFEGTIYNLNNGWYRTAKTHKTLGFDITVNASLAKVPSAKQTFTFNNADYINENSSVSLESGTSASLPTALGGETNERLVFRRNIQGTNRSVQQTVDAPEGLFAGEDFSDKAPLAMAQIGIGLIKKTDITIRFSPKVKEDDYDVQLYGIGLKHNILQYFPIAKRIPLVDVSLFAGYTKLESNYFPSGDDLKDVNINLDIQSFTAQVLGSVDLKIINFYVGLGYTGGKSSLNYSGVLTTRDDTTGIGTDLELDEISSADFEVKSFKTTLGASINLAFFKIYGDYSIQEYNSITAGIALSFR